MNIQNRYYQEEAADAAIEDILFSDIKINPVIVAPPGSGKSVIPCKIIDEYLTKFPEKTVLVLQDEENIIEQNHKKLVEYFEGIPIGIFSATIGAQQIHKITCAGIQSIFRKPHLFKNVGLIIIDECHKAGVEDKGMYRKFLSHFEDAFVVGLTATPWKGRRSIVEGDNKLFNKITYDLLDYEAYNRLVDEGYLVPLIPLPTDYFFDEDGIPLKDGDFDEIEMAKRFDLPEVTSKIIDRVCKYGKKYKKWLIYAIDKNHAENISKLINSKGIPCEAVYSGSTRSKVEVVGDFKRGDLRAVVNVGMLVTGVDVPGIDLIVFARLTNSPVWHVQTNGRGTRPVYAEGYDLNTTAGRLQAIANGPKTHCLVLDFGRNVQRLGPINGIVVDNEKKKKGVKRIMAKQCKNCGVDNHLRAVECASCGEKFEFEVKLQIMPSLSDIVKKEEVKKEPRWLKVNKVNYELFQHGGKAGTSLKVEYQCMLLKVPQFIMLEHKDYFPRSLAHGFIKNRYRGSEKIKTTRDLWKERAYLKIPSHIKIESNGKYMNIVDVKFDNGNNFDPVLVKAKEFEDDPKNIEYLKNFKKEISKIEIFDDDIPF